MKIVRRSCVPLVAVLVVMLAGCPQRESPDAAAVDDGARQELTESQRAEIARTVREAHREMITAWEDEDAFNAFMAHFARADHQARHDDVPFIVVTHTTYSTPEEVEATFRPILADRQTHVNLDDESVAVLSPDAAIHFARFTYTITRGGETQGPFAAAATSTWVRDGGQWKLLHYHQSWPNDTPVPAEEA